MPTLDIEKPAANHVPIAELMARTGLGRDAVYRALRARRIPCYRIGRVVRVDRHAFEAWIAAGGTASQAA